MAPDAPQQPPLRPRGLTDRARTESAPSLPAGTYFGRYRLVEEIGVGGMASVHLARMDGAAGFQKWVALKRVHPHLVQDEHFIKMFLDEARIAASISHPNVAQVFDLGSDGTMHWIAMEYLHGEPLRELMRHNMETGQPMRPELAARIVADAAEGLHAAHELRGKNGEPLNLVHRDVTPHNLFVTYDGVVKVVDFGIAKVAGRLANTTAGTLKGKIAYMAPEHIRGREIDRRADIFALGVVLWELTTNRRLFRADNDMETLERVRNCIIPPPSSVPMREEYPVQLEAIVMRALRRDPDERFPTAREMSRALQQYLMAAGEFVGPAEIGAYVSKAFAARIAQREEHLRWAAEFTESFSIGSQLPGAATAVTRTERTLPLEAIDTHADPPQAPRPEVPDEDSSSTMDSMQTVVQTKRALVASVLDDSASTARLPPRDKEALAQAYAAAMSTIGTGLPRSGLGRSRDDEESIATQVAPAVGQHRAPPEHSIGRAASAAADSGREDDPTRPMPSSGDAGPSAYRPEVMAQTTTDAEIARMKPRWGLYATYLMVFVLSAVTVFGVAALMLRARGDADEQRQEPGASAAAAAMPASAAASETGEAQAAGADNQAGGSASEPAVAPGYLTVDCVPACEHVVIDGRDMGPKASRVPLGPGRYEIALRGANGSRKDVSATVVSGEHTIQHVSLR